MAASHHREEDLSACFERLIINSKVKGQKNEGVLRCNYCTREFTNPQAMGGHQNTHKEERAREKQRRMALGIPQHGLGSSRRARAHQHQYQAPVFGSNRGFGRLGLGIQPTSMIRKPHTASSNVGFGQVAYHLNAWRLAEFQVHPTNHQPQAFSATDNTKSGFGFGFGSGSGSFKTTGFVGEGLSASFGMQGASSRFQSGLTLPASQSFGQRSNYSQKPETAQTEELDLELRL